MNWPGAPLNTIVSEENASFWDELCGSHLAQHLGITDASPDSLKKFDDWYMDYYPYLRRHVRFDALAGKDVLEVGLGYGTIAQMLAASGGRYRGLDIAAGPVAMVNHRLAQHGLSGNAQQGSVLAAPFADASFDYVVSIGCLHHTGDLQKALDEVWRVLRPGGEAMVMVYYAYSYRRWIYHPGATLRYLLWDKLGIGRAPVASAPERAMYDSNSKGEAAPETLFVSAGAMQRLCTRWQEVQVFRENTVQESVFKDASRESLNRWLGPLLGLDIYCHLKK